MPPAFQHRCKCCGVEFVSKRKEQKTCSQFCKSRLGGSTVIPGKVCNCGKPASKKGFCKDCARLRKNESKMRTYYRYRDAILKERRKQYAADHETKQKVKVSQVKSRFNGLRDARLKMDRYQCQDCGAGDNLVVHHISKRESRTKADKTSTINDLLTLCRKCHMNLHRALGDLSNSAIVRGPTVPSATRPWDF